MLILPIYRNLYKQNSLRLLIFFSEPSSSGYGSDSESIDDPLLKRMMVAESMEIVNVVDDVSEALEDTDQTRSVED